MARKKGSKDTYKRSPKARENLRLSAITREHKKILEFLTDEEKPLSQ